MVGLLLQYETREEAFEEAWFRAEAVGYLGVARTIREYAVQIFPTFPKGTARTGLQLNEMTYSSDGKDDSVC